MPLYPFAGISPQVRDAAFIAPSAELIGKVRVEAGASVWFGAVLRGDIEEIVVGPGSNIQDGAVLHTDEGFPCVVGADVTVGHRAVVHGATCADGSLVGMGAVMLSGSSLGEGAVLAAGALLPGGVAVPAGMLAAGVPARVLRPIERQMNAVRYREQARRYREQLGGLQPDQAPLEQVGGERA